MSPGMSPGSSPSQRGSEGLWGVLDAWPRLSKVPTKSGHQFCISGVSPLPDLGQQLPVPPAMPVTPKCSGSLCALAMVAPGVSPPAQPVLLTLLSSSPPQAHNPGFNKQVRRDC